MTTPLDSSRLHWQTLHRYLLAASLAWMGIVFLYPDLQRSVVGLTVSASLITSNFALSLCVLMWKKKLLVWLNLVQLPMFSLLQLQVYGVYGSSEYEVLREPQVYDWLIYTASHVLRVVDLLDFLETYNVRLQNIHHTGVLAGVLLVGLHISVGVFVLGAVLPWIMRRINRKKRANEQSFEDVRRALEWRMYRIWIPILCGVALIGVAIHQRWGWNAFYWTFDQVVRTLDVGDLCNIFNWQFHSIEMTFWISGFALLVRCAIGWPCLKFVTNHIVFPSVGDKFLTVQGLIEKHEDEEPSVRRRSAEVLGRLGIEARQALPALLVASSDPDEEVRTLAHAAVQTIDPEWPNNPKLRKCIADLVERLSEEDASARESAEKILDQLDPNWLTSPEAKQTIPSLIVRLTDASSIVRVHTEEWLTRLDPKWMHSQQARQTMATLMDRLAFWDEQTRAATRKVLSRIDPAWARSPEARKAIPKLIRRLHDLWPTVRKAAEQSLVEMGPDAVPQLLNALNTWDGWYTRRVLRIFGRMGEGAHVAVPELIAKLDESPEKGHHQDLVVALGKIGPSAKLSLPRLLALFHSSIKVDPNELRKALHQIDPAWEKLSPKEACEPIDVVG